MGARRWRRRRVHTRCASSVGHFGPVGDDGGRDSSKQGGRGPSRAAERESVAWQCLRKPSTLSAMPSMPYPPSLWQASRPIRSLPLFDPTHATTRWRRQRWWRQRLSKRIWPHSLPHSLCLRTVLSPLGPRWLSKVRRVLLLFGAVGFMLSTTVAVLAAVVSWLSGGATPATGLCNYRKEMDVGSGE